MTSTDLVDVFRSTKDVLGDAGVDDDFFIDLLASRLLIERVGESSNQGWWDSRVLSETGRARLDEVTPKTRLKSRINLASKVGRKAESDRLPTDSLSLFSFGPQVESRLAAAVDEIENGDDFALEALEDLSVQSLGHGWTEAIIDETASNISDDSESATPREPGFDGTLLIDENGFRPDEVEPEKWRLLTEFLRGYGSCVDQFHVPYCPLVSELTSENA